MIVRKENFSRNEKKKLWLAETIAVSLFARFVAHEKCWTTNTILFWTLKVSQSLSSVKPDASPAIQKGEKLEWIFSTIAYSHTNQSP